MRLRLVFYSLIRPMLQITHVNCSHCGKCFDKLRDELKGLNGVMKVQNDCSCFQQGTWPYILNKIQAKRNKKCRDIFVGICCLERIFPKRVESWPTCLPWRTCLPCSLTAIRCYNNPRRSKKSGIYKFCFTLIVSTLLVIDYSL